VRSCCSSSVLRDHSRSWITAGLSVASFRNSFRSVRSESPRTCASRLSSLAPATLKRSQTRARATSPPPDRAAPPWLNSRSPPCLPSASRRTARWLLRYPIVPTNQCTSPIIAGPLVLSKRAHCDPDQSCTDALGRPPSGSRSQPAPPRRGSYVGADGTYGSGQLLADRLVHPVYINNRCRTRERYRMGAALTYARRKALFALVGIAGEDDLDAPRPLASLPPRPKPTYATNGKQKKPSLHRPPPDQSAQLRDQMLVRSAV
jgi:hypothetical protein